MARIEIVCVMPFWSQGSALNWDSNYAYLRRVLPKMSEIHPDWLWCVLWPDSREGAKWKWYKDDLFKDKIFRFPWLYDSNMRMGVLGFEPGRFKELEESVSPTIFWLHQVEAGAAIADGYYGSFALRSKPAVVAQHHYIIHKSLPYGAMFSRLWYQIGGTIAAQKVVLNSDHTRTMLEESFAEYLNKAQMEQIAEKLQVLKFGLVEDWMTEVEIRNPEVPVVIYNHRFEHYKQPKITEEVFSTLRKKHRFEVWATQFIDQKLNIMKVDRIVGDPDQRKYFENIAVPAINTINSVHETYCISMVDSIALGQLPVAPNSVTFPELVPEGYPFLFDNVEQQIEMIDHILNTWPDEWEKWHEPLRRHAREVFGIENYCKAYADLLADEGARCMVESTPNQKTIDGIGQFSREMKPGRYQFEEMIKRLKQHTGGGAQSMPGRRVVRELANYPQFDLKWEENRLVGYWK